MILLIKILFLCAALAGLFNNIRRNQQPAVIVLNAVIVGFSIWLFVL